MPDGLDELGQRAWKLLAEFILRTAMPVQAGRIFYAPDDWPGDRHENAVLYTTQPFASHLREFSTLQAALHDADLLMELLTGGAVVLHPPPHERLEGLMREARAFLAT